MSLKFFALFCVFGLPGLFTADFRAESDSDVVVASGPFNVTSIRVQNDVTKVTVVERGVQFELFATELSTAKKQIPVTKSGLCRPNVFAKGTVFKGVFGLQATAVEPVSGSRSGCLTRGGLKFCTDAKPASTHADLTCENSKLLRAYECVPPKTRLYMTIRGDEIVNVRAEKSNQCLEKMYTNFAREKSDRELPLRSPPR